MPEGNRPRTSVYNRGVGNNFGANSSITVSAIGTVTIYLNDGTYVGADIEYDAFS